MNQNRFVRILQVVVLAGFSFSWGPDQALAQGNGKGTGRDPTKIKERIQNRVTTDKRLKAAAAAAATRQPGEKGPVALSLSTFPLVPSASMPGAGMHPDYFGAVIPNWGYSPTLHKFVDGMPGLGSANANNLGQYLSVAVPDTTTYPGCDYYEIVLVQYREKMHTDLPIATPLQGYVQLETNVVKGKHVALTYLDGATPILIGGTQAYAVDKPHYLGPVIVAQKNRPVRVKYTNKLPTGTGGDLFIPTDITVMGAGMGPYRAMPMAVSYTAGAATVVITTMAPHNLRVGERIVLDGFAPAAYNGMFTVEAVPDTTSFQVTLKSDPGGAPTTTGMVMENYTQNRSIIHLHGGLTPWVSDGTPHQWIIPAGEITQYPKGASKQDVPDMPDPGDNSMTFYYNNQQSARLLWYHDHAYGITRLNVYVGEVSAYLLTDQAEKDLIDGTNVSGANRTLAKLLPDAGIPLILQDKSFVDAATLPATNPTWNAGTSPGTALTGELWFPDVYMPNQNPNVLDGINAMGRWDYGPWFWPPWPATVGPVTNGTNPDGTPHVEPGYPDLSMTMESMLDTPMVNGTAYPYLSVEPRTYRFRILNGCNDRWWNLQLYVAASIVSSISVTNGGSGYTAAPPVTITAAPGDKNGHGATALATIDPATGAVTAVNLVSVGSGYTRIPAVTIAPPASGAQATATAALYTGLTEVGMVPAVQGAAAFPASWTVQAAGAPGDILDGRQGGVPDPALIGPSMVQIGTEGGFLPKPVSWPNIPIGHDNDPRSITVGNIKEHNLLLGCAERADVLIDFSQFAGKTLILYNDATAPAPAIDARLDYFTANPDYTDIGGHSPTQAGYGPNTRTVMQIRVGTTASPGTFALDAAHLAALQTAFATDPTTNEPGVFAKSQDPIIVPQDGYNSAYNGTFPNGTTAYERINSLSLSFNPLDLSTATPGDLVGAAITVQNMPKAIAEEFENWFGRMQGYLGVEVPFTNGQNQTTIWYDYMDPNTEEINECTATPLTPVSPADGTQIWKITHNGVDSHPIHFHLFNVQLVNRVDWAGVVKPPEDNELGWKETVRMNPLEDCIVALRVKAPTQPFGLPDSIRPLDPTMPPDFTGFKQVDPLGNPITPLLDNSKLVNFGWEYMWHCHILSHEEMDMMRPIRFNVARAVPAAPVLNVIGGSTASLNWTDGTPATDPATMGNPANEIGFRIERALHGDPAFATLATALANQVSYTDTTITPLSSYDYRVVAFNAAGESVSNVASLLSGLPTAPLNVVAAAGNTQATVSFSPPASDGGSAILSYTVTSSPDALNPSGVTATGAGSPITVAGLTNGTSYTFTVTATNANGTGPASAPSNAVTPAAPTVPSAPLNVTAVAGDAQATVSFSPPASDGGSAILTYTVTSSPDALNSSGVTATGAASPITVTGLTNGTSYTFTVTATNATGTGPASLASAPVTPAPAPTAPAAPSGVQVLGRTRSTLTIGWVDNSNNETSFEIQRSSAATGPWATVGTVLANVTQYTDTGLPRRTTYYYQVRSVNAVGASAWVPVPPVSGRTQ